MKNSSVVLSLLFLLIGASSADASVQISGALAHSSGAGAGSPVSVGWIPAGAKSDQSGAVSGANEGKKNTGREWALLANDKTIRTALGRWAEEAGWTLSWEIPGKDLQFSSGVIFTGTFISAVRQLAAGMESSELPIKAIFYKGNRVVRIVSAE